MGPIEVSPFPGRSKSILRIRTTSNTLSPLFHTHEKKGLFINVDKRSAQSASRTDGSKFVPCWCSIDAQLVGDMTFGIYTHLLCCDLVRVLLSGFIFFLQMTRARTMSEMSQVERSGRIDVLLLLIHPMLVGTPCVSCSMANDPHLIVMHFSPNFRIMGLPRLPSRFV